MKVLIIEDDKALADFLRKGLSYEGYKAFHRIDGKEGLEFIIKRKPDIVILDLGLPTLSGEEILKEMRKKDIMIPVIVLTGIRKPGQRIKFLNLGADDYLCKPFSFVELAARVKAVFRRATGGNAKNEIIEIDNLRINRNTRIVEKNGKRIKLRLKEFDLLLYMSQNPNEIISRETLIKNVWDYNTNFYSNTVDAHISSLRKKISSGSKKNIIETVHGMGYILNKN